jgi:endogenous inhibitor of DNA gyrase (YacG/DUF329 family)
MKKAASYYMEIVRCSNCGKDRERDGFSYNLEVHKFGKIDTCEHCNKISYPKEIRKNYWFCCRKCLDTFLAENKKEDFKPSWMR